MKYQLLKELLPYLEAFESMQAMSSHHQLDDFIDWLQSKKGSKSPIESNLSGDLPKTEQLPPMAFQSPSMAPQGDANAQITQLLSLMYKYMKFYIKKGFEETPLASPDDFGFLATLMMEGKMHKNALIDKNTIEFTSGMEVIKRLEKNGLIQSSIDQNDRRAKMVEATPSGKAVFFRLLPTLHQIGNIATATLTDAERTQLLNLLQKLNDFHNPIFHEAKKESITEIVENFVPS